MALTCIVVDKHGNILSDEELKNKVNANSFEDAFVSIATGGNL